MSPYRLAPRFSSVRSRTIGGVTVKGLAWGLANSEIDTSGTGRAKLQLVFLVIGVEFDPAGQTMRRISRPKYLCCERRVLGRISLRHRVKQLWQAGHFRSLRPGGSVHVHAVL
jgi:hypothetical protein